MHFPKTGKMPRLARLIQLPFVSEALVAHGIVYYCDGPGWVVWKESNNKYTIAVSYWCLITYKI